MYSHYFFFFFFSSRRRHTRCGRDWSSDVCSSDLGPHLVGVATSLDLGAELGEPVDVRIEPAPPDDIASRRCDDRAAAADEQRAGQKERGPHLGAEPAVELGLRSE